MKLVFTHQELRQIATLMTSMELLPVKVDSYGGHFLQMDGEETPFRLILEDDGTYVVSIDVSL